MTSSGRRRGAWPTGWREVGSRTASPCTGAPPGEQRGDDVQAGSTSIRSLIGATATPSAAAVSSAAERLAGPQPVPGLIAGANRIRYDVWRSPPSGTAGVPSRRR